MATEREKEREAELESAMYTNCFLLGLDPAVLGMTGSGGGSASPRVGNFRHSNPKIGEQLLYFLLSALRGPVQSAKDFDKVWPIFDSTQSRDFRKIVQGIISELESQGALPRSNSRVSSLATCCGPRFVELLWQLSVHALREVHKRTFAADVASNPLPATLTDVSYQHAAALLPVTKARIALERRKFLENANIAVQRQNTWSNLAQEMTAEFRGLCAEEAYLQQELEKLQEMKNKAKLDGELWDDRLSSSSSQVTPLVSKATRLWESLLAKRNQHEILVSGPIKDLIAHREHRYRISGSSLLAAMDLSSNVPHSDVLSVHSGDSSPSTDNREQMDSPQLQDKISGLDDRGGRIQPTVDVAEVLRRWTHALQRIHKQSLHLAKANNGQGPELLRSSSEGGASGHAESLGATLAEHRQHLASIQGLVNQLKGVIPTMQKSISELTEEVNSISSVQMEEYDLRSHSSLQSHSSGRVHENISDEVMERFSSVHLDKVTSSRTLKLPHLFSLTPNSLGKNTQTPKQPVITMSNHEVLRTSKAIMKQFTNDRAASTPEDPVLFDPQLIKHAVRKAALEKPSNDTELLQDRCSDDGSEHFFIPMSTSTSLKEDTALKHRKHQFDSSPPEIHVPKSRNSFSSATEPDRDSVGINGSPNWANMLVPTLVNARRFLGVEEDQVFSPPLLMEAFQDNYDDLLAPLSETDAALIEH